MNWGQNYHLNIVSLSLKVRVFSLAVWNSSMVTDLSAIVWAVEMTLSKAEKVKISAFWKFKCGPPLMSQNSCKMQIQCVLQCSLTILSLWITWISQETRLPHLTVGAIQICETTLSISVGVFDMVNHRKALPVSLPLDLKDVCGFPPSHQSLERKWGLFFFWCVSFMVYKIKLDFIERKGKTWKAHFLPY